MSNNPQTYKGTVIQESLKNAAVLPKNIQILETIVEPVTESHQTPHLKQWTMHTVEIQPQDIEEICQTMSKQLDTDHGHWYTDFKNTTTHYIVFSHKVFKVDRTKPEEYEAVKQYGVQIGIPAYQLDFSPDIL